MSETVNILSLVSYKFLPPKMGGQKGIAFFNRYLAAKCPITCVTTKNNEEVLSEGYLVKPILSNSPFRYINPFYFFTLSRIIRQEKITHLIIEHPYYGWLAVLLKWFCKITLIVHSHNIESYRFKSMGKWWWRILWGYEKLTHKYAHVNFFITHEDKEFAMANFGLNPAKCHTITYGFEMDKVPPDIEKQEAKKAVQAVHQIDEQDIILLFNGTLDYKPNLDALDIILHHINPLLLANKNLRYTIIICGKGLPSSYNALQAYSTKNIIYAGFVEDINMYFKGADIFINPVTDGGGIKTKLVEALGYGLSVVSTKSGAIGIPLDITGNKLYAVDDTDWSGFANTITQADPVATIPPAFFDHFYWGNIAAKVKSIIT